MVSPVVFLVTVWAVQFLVHISFDTGIDPPSALAWAIVVVGVVAFAAGAALVNLSFPQRPTLRGPDFSQSRSAAALVKISTPVAIFSAAVLVSQTIDQYQWVGLFNTLKTNLLEESLSGNKSSVFLVYTIIFNALCVLYYCNTIDFMARKKTLLLVVLTAILCLFSGSRALLMFFVIALLPALIFPQKKLTVRTAALIILAIVIIFAFFFSYPILFQSYDFESYGGETWKSYLSVYMLSGISAFSHFIETGEPSYNCMLMIPRPFKWVVDSLFSTNIINACPVIFQEVDVPLTTNVYSVFFQPMHDFGLVGVVGYLVIIGYAVNLAYRRGFIFGCANWRFIYCMFFFSTFMTFFEDQFARGFIYYAFAIIILASAWLIKKAKRYLVNI